MMEKIRPYRLVTNYYPDERFVQEYALAELGNVEVVEWAVESEQRYLEREQDEGESWNERYTTVYVVLLRYKEKE